MQFTDEELAHGVEGMILAEDFSTAYDPDFIARSEASLAASLERVMLENNNTPSPVNDYYSSEDEAVIYTGPPQGDMFDTASSEDDDEFDLDWFMNDMIEGFAQAIADLYVLPDDLATEIVDVIIDDTLGRTAPSV